VKGEVVQENCCLAEIAQEVVGSLKAGAARAGLDINFVDCSGDDAAIVAGDRKLLRRVINNLVGNAVKFTPPGGRITVRAKRSASSAIIEVEDTGKGIPSDLLQIIFERFYQIDSGPARHYGGLGIGLAIVDEITRSHGGQVHVDSKVGHGTTFSVVLPIQGNGKAAA
jgi:two-component system sensor histidine kinase BaeS